MRIEYAWLIFTKFYGEYTYAMSLTLQTRLHILLIGPELEIVKLIIF